MSNASHDLSRWLLSEKYSKMLAEGQLSNLRGYKRRRKAIARGINLKRDGILVKTFVRALGG
jgi:hypothetical protein